jgi:hypothetical protein
MTALQLVALAELFVDESGAYTSLKARTIAVVRCAETACTHALE